MLTLPKNSPTRISVNQYLMGRAKLEELSDEQVRNINTLIPKVNELLERYGKPVTMSSGFRSKEDQMRINPKAPNSRHCLGAAIDIADKDHNFRYYCLTHLNDLIELGLYMEDPVHTPSWLHLQIIAPKSGKRIFIP